jgi:hypothetical protein
VRLCLSMLLLCGWPRRLLWLTLFFGLLFFRLVLRVRWNNRTEKQKQANSTDSSKEFHSDRLQ